MQNNYLSQSIVVCVILLAFTVQPAQAHRGGPPFVKVDNVLTKPYPVQITSVPEMMTPQEISPATYRVGEAINFEIDRNALALVGTFPADTQFFWDFGDGNKASSETTRHAFAKAQSYIVMIHATTAEVTEPQLIETFYLAILPNADYVLPEPIITVNGEQSSDPASDVITVDFSKPVTFSATRTKKGTSTIASYSWDFGDTESSNQKEAHHQYSQYAAGTITAVLHIVDTEGFDVLGTVGDPLLPKMKGYADAFAKQR